MPTLINFIPLRRYAHSIADLIQACSESHPVKRCEGQICEYLEASPDHGVKLIEQGGAFRRRALELCGVGEGPAGRHELAGEIGAELALRRIAERDHEIHAGSKGAFELVPRFASQIGNIVTQKFQTFEHLGKRRFGRLRTGGVAAEMSAPDLFK